VGPKTQNCVAEALVTSPSGITTSRAVGQNLRNWQPALQAMGTLPEAEITHCEAFRTF